MVNEVGRFLDETLITLTLGGKDQFDGFFADLLDYFVFARNEKFIGVGTGSGMDLAILQCFEQFVYFVTHGYTYQ